MCSQQLQNLYSVGKCIEALRAQERVAKAGYITRKRMCFYLWV